MKHFVSSFSKRHDDFKMFPDKFERKSLSVVVLVWRVLKLFNILARGRGGRAQKPSGLNSVKGGQKILQSVRFEDPILFI